MKHSLKCTKLGYVMRKSKQLQHKECKWEPLVSVYANTQEHKTCCFAASHQCMCVNEQKDFKIDILLKWPQDIIHWWNYAKELQADLRQCKIRWTLYNGWTKAVLGSTNCGTNFKQQNFNQLPNETAKAGQGQQPLKTTAICAYLHGETGQLLRLIYDLCLQQLQEGRHHLLWYTEGYTKEGSTLSNKRHMCL